MDADPGSGVVSVHSSLHRDAFLLKWDYSGDFESVQVFGQGDAPASPQSITTDDFGNVYLAGIFEDSSDFDPGPGEHYLYAEGDQDLWLTKVGPNGNLKWAKSYGSPQSSSNNVGLSLDPAGNVFVACSYESPINFGGTSGTTMAVPAGHTGSCIVMLDTMGEPLWMKCVNGIAAWLGGALYANGSVYWAGQFRDTLYHDLGGIPTSIISPGTNQGTPDYDLSLIHI